MGAGTEGVRKCDNAQDVVHAFAAECASGKLNVCGVQNSGLIAQEFLKGTEYVVDGISCGKGQHAVVAMFKYQKLPDLTYEYTTVIESSGKVQESLCVPMWQRFSMQLGSISVPAMQRLS